MNRRKKSRSELADELADTRAMLGDAHERIIQYKEARKAVLLLHKPKLREDIGSPKIRAECAVCVGPWPCATVLAYMESGEKRAVE